MWCRVLPQARSCTAPCVGLALIAPPSLSPSRARVLSPLPPSRALSTPPIPTPLRARLRATASRKQCSKTGPRPRTPTLSRLLLPRARSARVRCLPARSRLALLSSCPALVLSCSLLLLLLQASLARSCAGDAFVARAGDAFVACAWCRCSWSALVCLLRSAIRLA